MSTRTPSAQLVAPQGDLGNAQRVQVQNDWGWYGYDAGATGAPSTDYAGRTYELGQTNLPNAPGNPFSADNTRFAQLEAGDIAFTYDPAPAANQGDRYGKWVCIFKGTQAVGNAAGVRALWARMDNQAGSTVVQSIRDAHAIVVGIDAARVATINAVGQNIEPDVAGETCDWIDPGDGSQLDVALLAAGAMGGQGVDLRIRPGDILRNTLAGPFVVPNSVRVIGAMGNNGASLTTVGVVAPATDARVFALGLDATLENLRVDSQLATHVGPATGVVDGGANINCTLRNVQVLYAQVAGALPAGIYTTTPGLWELITVLVSGQFSTTSPSIGIFFDAQPNTGTEDRVTRLRDVTIVAFDTGLRTYAQRIDSHGLVVRAAQFGVRVGRSGGGPLSSIANPSDYATFVDTDIVLDASTIDLSGDLRAGVYIEGRIFVGPGAEFGSVLAPTFVVLGIRDRAPLADETDWHAILIASVAGSGNVGSVYQPKFSKVRCFNWHRIGVRISVQAGSAVRNGDFDQILLQGTGYIGAPSNNIGMDLNFAGGTATLTDASTFRALTVRDQVAQTGGTIGVRITGVGHDVSGINVVHAPASTAGRALQFGPTATNVRVRGAQLRGFNFGALFNLTASRCALADGYVEAIGATATDFAIQLQASPAADHSIHDNALFAPFGAANIIENLGSVGTDSHNNITLASATV